MLVLCYYYNFYKHINSIRSNHFIMYSKMTTVHDLPVNSSDAVTEARTILQQIVEYPIDIWMTGVAVCSNNRRYF